MAGRPHVEIARDAIMGGARVIQLRDKHATRDELVSVARELRELTRRLGATFIVNDNPFLARDVDADGVHVGQGDAAVDIARGIVGDNRIVGLSTHSMEQAIAATFKPVDYIGVGPVFATSSKVSEWPVVGTDLVRRVRESVSFPVVAIGGITGERVAEVVAAGADNIAIIGDLMKAPDIEGRTRWLCGEFQRAEQARAAYSRKDGQ